MHEFEPNYESLEISHESKPYQTSFSNLYPGEREAPKIE